MEEEKIKLKHGQTYKCHGEWDTYLIKIIKNKKNGEFEYDILENKSATFASEPQPIDLREAELITNP